MGTEVQHLEMNGATNTPSLVVYKDKKVGQLQTKDDYEVASKGLLSQLSTVSTENLLVKKNNCEENANLCAVIVTQQYQGIPVFRAHSGVWFKDGKVMQARSTLIPQIGVSIQPELDSAQLEPIARKKLLEMGYVHDSKIPLSVRETSTVLYPDENKVVHLAARLDIEQMEVVTLNDDSPGITLSEPSIFIAVNGPRKGDVLEVLETLNSETIGGQVTG